MSGHNKWSKIKNQKGEADVEKGKLFTYFARRIALAVKEQKGLEQVLEEARAANIPRHIIDKSLRKNNEEKALEELIYEGFLANGKIGLIIVAKTDNSTRTSNQIRNILDKHAGKFAEPGALNYMFQKQGILYINKSDENEKLILDSGASDYFEEKDEFRVEGEASRLKEITDFFEGKMSKLIQKK